MKLTKEQVAKALPIKARSAVSSAVVEQINKILSNEEERRLYAENLLNYNSVLQEGKYKVSDYIGAVMYVSFKLMNHSNMDAYARAFPGRMERLQSEGKTLNQIHNYVSGYNRTKLVVAITQQSIVPTHILNQPIYQEAINVLAKEMRTAKTDIARVTAAGKLMDHLAPPTDAKLKIDIGVETTFLENVRSSLAELSQAQLQSISMGHKTATEIAGSRIIEGEVKEIA